MRRAEGENWDTCKTHSEAQNGRYPRMSHDLEVK